MPRRPLTMDERHVITYMHQAGYSPAAVGPAGAASLLPLAVRPEK